MKSLTKILVLALKYIINNNKAIWMSYIILKLIMYGAAISHWTRKLLFASLTTGIVYFMQDKIVLFQLEFRNSKKYFLTNILSNQGCL